jgi:hypothetical protein
MAAMSLNEHVHNSTELNSCEGTMSRKILGYRILPGFQQSAEPAF